MGLQPHIQQAGTWAGRGGKQRSRLAGKALAIAALFPELHAHEHAHTADDGSGHFGQALPSRLFTDFAALQGQPGTEDTVLAAMQTLRDEFQPISDMRASAHYRQTVLGNLLQRFWLESQGLQSINLDSLKTVEALA